ncbi:MAG TPA: hypothetical protein P5320_06620 [Bacteroidales bacterium]|nr:hypothetical protein [Bacteroidales bacterium]HOK74907.1 hypothetical protein [Bacteroidales bacterium]HOM41233.1 hypothetical protein [Bacteroidales bacterium]HPP93270.1 hypothetical protein [Bacteroidales bacterium]HRR16381.1 hypothetical protein [Bacteroidales bacterium]
MKLFKLLLVSIAFYGCVSQDGKDIIMTVNGPVKAESTGRWLTHEHILVDFIGADSISPGRYNRQDVIRKTLPFLLQARDLGCRTFVECTPEYLGRDPELLRTLADSSGLNILTNTGFYGAVNNKYIPSFAFSLTAEELAGIWTGEWEKGIGQTGIKPGFIKISVERDSLSEFHARLVKAAAITHLKTGLVIASHTGPSIPAFQQIELLEKEGVSPEAFIWIHAQAEKDPEVLCRAALKGAWVSIDNLNEDNVNDFVSILKAMKEKGCLNRVLISHDAGWYDPAKENGGDFRGFTTMFEKLIPELKNNGFTDKEIKQVFEVNPARAFAVRIRRLKN